MSVIFCIVGRPKHFFVLLGKYPIHSAAVTRVTASSSDTTAALQYLIKEAGKAEDIHLVDDNDNTPLHDAAYYGEESKAGTT